MMTLLNLTTDDYPCSLWQVRQANPNVSFPASPSDADLAPFGYVNVQPTNQPSYDQRTERVEEGAPKPDADGSYRQQWTIRPATAEELAAYDEANRPAPDWAAFKATALASASLNQIVAAALQSAPVAAASLAPALLRAEANGSDDFAGAWAAICAAVPVPPEAIAGFQQVAQACNLPEAFVAALEPAAPAPTRARNPDGTFTADDPATPENEAWVAA